MQGLAAAGTAGAMRARVDWFIGTAWHESCSGTDWSKEDIVKKNSKKRLIVNSEQVRTLVLSRIVLREIRGGMTSTTNTQQCDDNTATDYCAPQ